MIYISLHDHCTSITQYLHILYTTYHCMSITHDLHILYMIIVRVLHMIYISFTRHVYHHVILVENVESRLNKTTNYLCTEVHVFNYNS